MKQLVSHIIGHKHVYGAIIIAMLLVVADYIMSNASYPLLDSSDSLAPYAYLLDPEDGPDDEIVCVNVAYDKELTTVRDEFGDSLGSVAITNRSTLLRFLDLASNSAYRYIFLDIRFEDGLETENDSALFARIKSMPRLVFSTHRGLEDDISDPALRAKSAYADYRHKRLSGFSRYEFIQDDQESVALRMYRELDGGEIHSCPLGYADKGRLCHNTLFISLPLSATDAYGPDGEILHPHLGSQLMVKYSAAELQQLLDNKIVLIGDFENDLHSTFIGDVPGPLLSYYAYLALHQGNHRVNYWLYVFLFAIYFGITLTLFGRMPLKIKVKRPLLVLALSFVGWGLVLCSLKIALFLLLSLDFCATIPAAVFSLISFYKKINNRNLS